MADLKNINKCVTCNAQIDRNTTTTAEFPCGCRLHMECYIRRVFIYHLSSCPVCIPQDGVYEDFGDCVSVNHLDLTYTQRESLRRTLHERVTSYSPAEISGHSLAMLDANAKNCSEKEKIERFMAATCGVPTPVMTKWMPGANREPEIEALLKLHTAPLDLRRVGIDSTAINNAGITYDRLVGFLYTLKELRDLGFSWMGLVAVGFRCHHLCNRVSTPVRDLVQVFHVNYAKLLDVEKGYYRGSGPVYSYATVGLNIEEHYVLDMTSFKCLIDYGLDRLALMTFANVLSFDEMEDLHMTPQMLKDMDMLSEEGLEELKVPDEETVRRWLPPNTKLRADMEAEEQARELEKRKREEKKEKRAIRTDTLVDHHAGEGSSVRSRKPRIDEDAPWWE